LGFGWGDRGEEKRKGKRSGRKKGPQWWGAQGESENGKGKNKESVEGIS